MKGLRQLFASLTNSQRLSILLVVMGLACAFWYATEWNRDRNLRPLYTGLAADDAGAVLDRLRTSNISFKVTESEHGATILVDSARVAELRLELAGAGLPRTGRIGLELFDKANFGMSDFAEQVNLRRAIEGELERSVVGLSEVERARVHLTFGKDSVFLESRRPAKASVMVRLRPHRQLSAQNVLAIKHLTSSAVDGLSPEAVSVLDMDGNLLGRGRTTVEGDESGSASAAFDFRQNLEKDLRSKIMATLDPVLGSEKYRAGVSVECDFTSAEQAEETYDPNRSVMSSSAKTEDVSGGGVSGGIPGAASNLPRPPARVDAAGKNVARRTENIQFQTSRSYRKVKIPQGQIKRVSVAILIDQNVRWEGTGAKSKKILEAPAPERLKVIKDLVVGVAGIQADRGDQVLVETLPFESTLQAGPPEPAAPPALAPPPGAGLPSWLAGLVNKFGFPAVIGASLAVALFVIVVPLGLLLRRNAGKGRELEAGPGPEALPAAPRAPALAEGEVQQPFEKRAMAQLAQNEADKQFRDQELLASLKLPAGTKKGEVLKKHIAEEARKDPAAIAQLLRAWLNETEA